MLSIPLKDIVQRKAAAEREANRKLIEALAFDKFREEREEQRVIVAKAAYLQERFDAFTHHFWALRARGRAPSPEAPALSPQQQVLFDPRLLSRILLHLPSPAEILRASLVLPRVAEAVDQAVDHAIKRCDCFVDVYCRPHLHDRPKPWDTRPKACTCDEDTYCPAVALRGRLEGR